MERRKFVTIASSIGVTALAGCLNSGPGSGQSSGSPPEVEVEFLVSKDGDLVANHVGGDVLPTGQQVYLTVTGEKVAEATVSEDVRVGGEIIRATNITDEDQYTGSKLVGLYTQQGGDDVELASAEVNIYEPSPNAPNAQINFDYDSSSETLNVYHDGGATINTGNTEALRWGGSNANDMTFGDDQDYIDSDGTVTDSIQAGDKIGSGSIPSNGDVELVWITNDGNTSATLGTWEGPQA